MIVKLILQIVSDIIKYWTDPDRMERSIERRLLDAHAKRVDTASEALDESDEEKLVSAIADLKRAARRRGLQDEDNA